MLRFFFLVLFLTTFSIAIAVDFTITGFVGLVKSGDLEGDGDNDIVVVPSGQTYFTLLLNNGNGDFSIHEVEPFSSNVYVVNSLDDNSILDIITGFTSQEGEYFRLVYYNSDFQNPFFYGPYEEHIPNRPASGDIDGDGDNDLVYFCREIYGQDNNFWGYSYNLGNREFSDINWNLCTNQAGNTEWLKIECFDIDENGYDDVLAFSFAETYIIYNDESGYEMDSLGYDYIAQNGSFSDLDSDGDLDIAISQWAVYPLNLHIYENIGSREFVVYDQYNEDVWDEVYPADMNCDGLMDLNTVGSNSGLLCYYNQGDFIFTDTIQQDIPNYNSSYLVDTFNDFDGNGTTDVAIIRTGLEANNLSVYFNNGEGILLDEPVDVNEQLISNNSELIISNYPNPFNPTTTISFTTAEYAEKAEIAIYNLKGQRVKTLFNDRLEAGDHCVVWNGDDETGNTVSSGVFLYKIEANNETATGKMLLLK